MASVATRGEEPGPPVMEDPESESRPRDRDRTHLSSRPSATHRDPPARRRGAGRPAPRIQRRSGTSREQLRHELEESFPLLFFAAACFVMSAFALSTNTHVGGTRYPLWVLFLTLGVIAAGGGTASLFASDDLDGFDEAGLASGELVAVPRSEWERLRRPASVAPSPTRTAATAAPSPAPAVPAPRRSVRPEWEELEDDREVVTPLVVAGDAADGLVPRSEDMLSEIDALETVLNLGRPGSGIDAEGNRSTAEPGPSITPDPAVLSPSTGTEAWLDAALLPPEIPGVVDEGNPWPPIVSGLAPVSRGVAPVLPENPEKVECVNCHGRIRSSIAECANCHGPMCRTCHEMARLTSEEARCDACLALPAGRADTPSEATTSPSDGASNPRRGASGSSQSR